MKIKRNKKKSGFSLIEALVALGILLLGIVPVVTLATQAILFHHRAGEGEEAARISQTMIDYIKSRGYDNLGEFTTITPYTLTPTSNGAFTISEFASDFNIDNEMVLLNSKGINLNQVSFYIKIGATNGKLKNYKKDSDSNKIPATGEESNNVYEKNIIYGKLIFGFGKDGQTTKTGREKELLTTFIITPIENWK